ncbi:hypothetical protein Vretifemale_15436, partial [Volvox reticuliferus]
MHIRSPPSFFAANNIGDPHGDVDGWMRPLFKRSSTCRFTSSISCGERRYIREKTGFVSGSRSIVCPIPRSLGRPWIGSKTSMYSSSKALSSESFMISGCSFGACCGVTKVL